MQKTLTSPIASLVVLVFGVQYFNTFVTVALDKAGYTEFYIGLVHAASYFGLLVSALYCEIIIRRVGHIRAFTLFSSVIAITILIQSFLVNYVLWIFTRFFSGFALAGLYVTIESWLIFDSKIEDRGQRLAIYMIALYAAQAVSSQLFNVIDPNTMAPYVIAAIFCIFSNVPMSLTYKDSPVLPNSAELKIHEVFSISRFAFIGCFISGIVLSSLYSFIPKYALEYDITVAWSMTVLISGGFIMQWPLGKLSDIVNRELMLTVHAIVTGLIAILLMCFSNVYISYVLLFLLGGTAFAVYPISISCACDLIKNKCIVQITAVLLFAYGIGSVIGPILSASTIDWFNSSLAIFGFSAFFLWMYGAFGIYRILIGRLKVPMEEDTVNCIPFPQHGHVANQLDPRQELEKEEGDLQQAMIEEDIIHQEIDTLDVATSPANNP